jgi:protein gp37
MPTGIEWCDETWNPTTGCDRTSPGCDHCYALDMAARLKAMGSAGYQNDGDPRTSGPGFALTMHEDRLDQPIRWKRPRRIFVNSMSDLFHTDVTDSFRLDVWQVMGAARQHTYQILTKRPQAMGQFCRRLAWVYPPKTNVTTGEPYLDIEQESRDITEMLPNVWLGTSIENDTFTFRASHLRQTPAVVRFLSLEPLLGPLPSLDLTGIDWVIVGGESGPGARPMHPDWARDVRDRCVAAGVPFLFKQWGEYRPTIAGEWVPPWPVQVFGDGKVPKRGVGMTVEQMTDPGTISMMRVGKHKAGRELDGRTWDEYPERAR